MSPGLLVPSRPRHLGARTPPQLRRPEPGASGCRPAGLTRAALGSRGFREDTVPQSLHSAGRGASGAWLLPSSYLLNPSLLRAKGVGPNCTEGEKGRQGPAWPGLSNTQTQTEQDAPAQRLQQLRPSPRHRHCKQQVPLVTQPPPGHAWMTTAWFSRQRYTILPCD